MRDVLDKALSEAELDDNQALGAIKRGLQAKQRAVSKVGECVEVVELGDDHNSQLKASDQYFKLRGLYADTSK